MKEQLCKAFYERFQQEAAVISRAPGRLEILGNHTDYNGGTVLSTAVDRFMHIAAAPSGTNLCTLKDAVLGEERSFALEDVEKCVKGDWANYIKGMVAELRKAGIQVPGFNAVLSGNVPLSAGMSSSAALEMASGLALCRLAGTELSWLDMAKTGQACENNCIGAKTGLLDQFSSLRGKKDALVYSDFRSLETDTIAMPDEASFVVVNCMVKHTLTNEYNDRRAACEEAVKFIASQNSEVKCLRDVPPDMLQKYKGSMDSTAFDCASHVVGEIFRVAEGIRALKENDLAYFGKLMFQSHESSRYLFNNSCSELDTIIDIAASIPQCLGARLSGGGFGGITVHLVKKEDAQEYGDKVSAAYESATGIHPQVILCNAADGATIL